MSIALAISQLFVASIDPYDKAVVRVVSII